MPELYFDLGSPYAYLAVERAPQVLGVAPVLRPVLLGAIFRARGSGSWARTEARAAGIAEVERRAAAYGLPPLRWPPGWPGNGLQAMRAAVWAEERGALDAFARAAYRRAFADGADITTVDALVAVAEEAGLPGGELPAALASDAIKARLREATDAAWARGVRGVPTLAIGGALHYGDDQLEAAAAAA